ncbi:hypothetical protein [Enterococcus cecorum]|uniref:hypothetical protein n=1 Tax=Enterococcus cecorum TaxID=44008 RepID=UPI001FAE23B1|nr:hypothetical protein [Enterococcus cecorum]MCJ0586020.1 hypothetical protein [Enterococcus cecorum]
MKTNENKYLSEDKKMEEQIEFQSVEGYLTTLNLKTKEKLDNKETTYNLKSDIKYFVNEADKSQIKNIIYLELIENETEQEILSLEYETYFKTNNHQSRLSDGDSFVVQQLSEYSCKKVAEILMSVCFEAFGRNIDIFPHISEVE